MDVLEAMIHEFLEKAKNGEIELDVNLLREYMDNSKKALIRQFSKRDEPFRLRASNIGRPTCQLWMEAHGVEGENPSHHIIRNLYGDMIENMIVFILDSMGIVRAKQLPVTTKIGDIQIDGTLDVILELDRELSVWDVKSASNWAFTHKTSFEDMMKDDYFGYVAQLFLYAEGTNVRPGGWIFVDKSTGEVRIIRVPTFYRKAKEQIFRKIKRDTAGFNSRERFRRDFNDVPYTFNRRETGDRILQRVCEWCPFKFPCWPGLTVSSGGVSKSRNPILRYFTVLNTNVEIDNLSVAEGE